MNIYLIVRGFPTDKDPQWGCFEFDQAKALAAKGHKVTMLSVDVRWKSKYRRPGIKKNESVGVVSYDLYCGPWVVLSAISMSLYDKLTEVLLMKLFKHVIKTEGRPDIIYSHYLDSSDYALPIKNKYNIPIVGLEHWSELGKEQPSERAIKKAQRVYPQLDKLLVVSNALKENVKKFTGVSSIVLPNVIGVEFVVKRKIRKPQDVVKFVSTGNLIGRKRMDLIIKALCGLRQRGINADVTIVGEGEDRPLLESLINKQNLLDCVHLTGRKTRAEIVTILNDSDVYIMASSSETFGVAAAEALACGLPVIATDCGGPRDFISDVNGIMIPVNDEDKLVDAMIYMIEHHTEYDHSMISADFHKRFSAEAVANQLTEIFGNVCKR